MKCILLPDFGSNEASALPKFYLHPLRFVGTRLDCNCYRAHTFMVPTLTAIYKLLEWFPLIIGQCAIVFITCSHFVLQRVKEVGKNIELSINIANQDEMTCDPTVSQTTAQTNSYIAFVLTGTFYTEISIMYSECGPQAVT